MQAKHVDIYILHTFFRRHFRNGPLLLLRAPQYLRPLNFLVFLVMQASFTLSSVLKNDTLEMTVLFHDQTIIRCSQCLHVSPTQHMDTGLLIPLKGHMERQFAITNRDLSQTGTYDTLHHIFIHFENVYKGYGDELISRWTVPALSFCSSIYIRVASCKAYDTYSYFTDTVCLYVCICVCMCVYVYICVFICYTSTKTIIIRIILE